MALRIYSGEYLISPLLLHFGGNWCTHNCCYCFANLNKPDRLADPNDLARIIKWYATDSTCLEYQLMKAGHPVLMSNDSDPCSKSNAALHQAVRGVLDERGVRVTYQTRGGEPDAELRIVNSVPTMVYISLTTDDEAIRAHREPSAPPHEQRMAFIRRLKAAGHHVVIGLNPFVPAWWNDLAATFEELREIGVGHVWHQAMHLSRWQVAAMRETTKAKHFDLIEYGAKKKAPDAEEYGAGLKTLRLLGYNLIAGGVSENLGFWDDYFALGFPFAPTLDALVRDCGKVAPVLGIEKKHFDAWSDIGFPQQRAVWKEFVNGFGRSIRNAGERTEIVRSQADVNSFLWRVEDFPTRLSHPCFARIGYQDGYATDISGSRYMAVSAAGFSEFEVAESECTFINRPPKRN